MHRWSQLSLSPPSVKRPQTPKSPATSRASSEPATSASSGAGIYSYLFLGNRSINKNIAIVREEMDRKGQEFFPSPPLNPEGDMGGERPLVRHG